MAEIVDLRSDTVTKPTEAMRRAMASAEVGDDVLGDDPTVNELECATAEILGKAAAVYMPSGSMTNQVALRTHTEPGDEVLMADNGHMYIYEAGAPGGISRVMGKLLQSHRGMFTAEAVRSWLKTLEIGQTEKYVELVPEPATLGVLVLGAVGVLLRRRRVR